MELSLVVPVWNDLPGLERLLRQVAELGIFTQVIIADDCSDVPVGPETLPVAAAAFKDKIIWLRSDRRRGAGHSANACATNP